MVDLPNELWLQVLQEVTPTSYLLASDYLPFQGLHSLAGAQYRVQALVLIQVCRRWRQMALEMFYSNVKVGQCERTQCAMQSSLAPYSSLVRTIELPYRCTSTKAYRSTPLPAVDILRVCAHLSTLVRPATIDRPAFSFDADNVLHLPALQCLEWWQNWEAERSGGINSLIEVLSAAPNLRCLFIGDNTSSSMMPVGAQKVELPLLRVLRVHAISGVLLHRVAYVWMFPSLTHIVIDAPPSMGGDMDCLWERLGPQLEVVEFGKSLRFMGTETMVSTCLARCQNLKELNYYPLCMPGASVQDRHYSLTSVGLNVTYGNPYFRSEQKVWDLMDSHFSGLVDVVFPNLKTVSLFYCAAGEAFWGKKIGKWKDALSERDCALKLVQC